MMNQFSLFETLTFERPIKAYFSVDRNDFLRAIRQIRKGLQYHRNSKFTLQIELYVFEQRVLLRIFEQEYWLEAETSNFCYVQCYYQDLFEAVRNESAKQIKVCFNPKRMTVNNASITALKIDFEIVSKEIPLSTTFPDRREYNSYEPTKEKHLISKDGTQGYLFDTVQKDVRYVTAALKKYNIPRGEIEQFIYSYLTLPKR